jgi:ABC-type sugar transport system substrate-binding protein
MRRLGRLGSAALVGTAALLMAACGHSAPSQGTAATPGAGQISATAGTAAGASGGVSSTQLNQIDNQISQIDNQIGQANQGLATSEGDPTQ